MSSSEFKCNSNTLILNWIRHELSELCEFYKIFPKVENVHIIPLVLTADCGEYKIATYPSPILQNILNIWTNEMMIYCYDKQ